MSHADNGMVKIVSSSLLISFLQALKSSHPQRGYIQNFQSFIVGTTWILCRPYRSYTNNRPGTRKKRFARNGILSSLHIDIFIPYIVMCWADEIPFSGLF